MPDPASIRSILVIKLRAIGDVILSTAVIPDLVRAFPGAAVDFLTEAPAAGAVEGLPGIRKVIVHRRGAGSLGRLRPRHRSFRQSAERHRHAPERGEAPLRIPVQLAGLVL
jgi:ADP-heptose:LPS heptosyltransferase